VFEVGKVLQLLCMLLSLKHLLLSPPLLLLLLLLTGL
jgi:hypothetical protein